MQRGSSLGPLTEFKGEELRLRGWRGISLLNIAAVLTPVVLAIVIFFAGGAWLILSLGLFLFSAYGVWTMGRSATTRLRFDNEAVIINGRRFGRFEVQRFEGRRLAEPTGMDDSPESTEVWLVLTNEIEIPIAQMSGHAPAEAIAAYLNEKLRAGNANSAD